METDRLQNIKCVTTRKHSVSISGSEKKTENQKFHFKHLKLVPQLSFDEKLCVYPVQLFFYRL